MPRTYNEIDARITRLMKELKNLKKELAGKQGTLEDGDGIVLTPDTQTNKTTVSVDENVVALKEDFEANPTLAGTEPTLEGLKLLGTNYKVGGGGNTLKLYRHSISFDTDITFTDFQNVEKTVLTTFKFIAISDRQNAIPNYASIMSIMNSVKFLTPVTAKFKTTDNNAFCYCIGSNVTATGIYQNLDAFLCFRDVATGSQVKFNLYQNINSSKQKNFKDNVTPFNFVE